MVHEDSFGIVKRAGDTNHVCVTDRFEPAYSAEVRGIYGSLPKYNSVLEKV